MGSYRRTVVGVYSLGTLAGRPVAVWREGGERRRFRLGKKGLSQAEAEAALHVFARQRTRMMETEGDKTIAQLFDAYVKDKQLDGKPTVNQGWMWKALAPTFAHLTADDIDKGVCRAYERRRSAAGKKPGTIWSELIVLRTVLNWAVKAKLIDLAPEVAIPKKPPPRDVFVSRDELGRLLDAADLPHVKLYIVLAITTAGRMGALLDLTWDRVDFDRGMIDLYNPSKERNSKGRALVPMNDSARAALAAAKPGALSPYVIEWGGLKVATIRKGIETASRKAGITCTPHTIRHTAARWMAEAGVPMEEIASYMGHSNPATTYRVYARYSPDYLRKAAGALELPAVRKVV